MNIGEFVIARNLAGFLAEPWKTFRCLKADHQRNTTHILIYKHPLSGNISVACSSVPCRPPTISCIAAVTRFQRGRDYLQSTHGQNTWWHSEQPLMRNTHTHTESLQQLEVCHNVTWPSCVPVHWRRDLFHSLTFTMTHKCSLCFQIKGH